MAFHIAQATLEDWNDLKEFWEAFRAGRHGKRVDTGTQELRNYFLASQVNPVPQNMVAVLVGRIEGKLVAAAVLQVIQQPVPDSGQMVQNVFVVGIHSSPGVGNDFRRAFLHAMDWWGVERKCVNLVGNVRMGYKFEAVEKMYGFKRWHCVVGRKIGDPLEIRKQAR